MLDKNRLFLVIMLIIINIIAHFLPLERASIGGDEWFFLVKSKNIKTLHIPLQTLKVADSEGFPIVLYDNSWR